MFIVKYYASAAIFALLMALYSESIYFTVLFAWICLSLSLVTVAYLFDLPWIFRKKSNGSIPFYMRWLFVPFLLGAQLYNGWARKNDSVPPLQLIDDHLFLACRLFPSDMLSLKQQNITGILDVTAEFDGLDWSAESEELDYLNVPVLDHCSPAPDKLISAIHWIENHVREKRSVVVHCALGRGRSVLVVAAYLMSKYPDLTVEQALTKIQGIRTTAGLNKTQLKALKRLQEAGKLKLRPELWIVANPVSGGGKWPEAKDEVVQRLSQHFVLNILETTAEISATQLAQQAIESGAKTVIASGGDGTLTEVAQVLASTDKTMGILPMGTANALAHVLLGLSSKIIPVSRACDVIIKGYKTHIDTALCNDSQMLLVAGIGFEQQMIEGADRGQKDIGGQGAYLSALWRAVDRNQILELNITLDEKPTKTIKTTSLVIANAAPSTTILAQGGGAPDLTDGFLDVTWVLPKADISERVVSLAELAISGLELGLESSSNCHEKVQRIRISAEAAIDYVVDGENFSADHLDIRVQPAALEVFVDPPY
jgi:diacylglycerol kinase family enzyme